MTLKDTNIFIVAHGDSKFNYTKNCIDYFSQYDNVIWSSWTDTPADVINLLKEKNILYTLNDYPPNIGMSYQNYQKYGFLNGLNIAKSLGAKYIYKIRNDLEISNLDNLLIHLKYKIENYNGKLLQALCWDNLCNGICDYGMFGEINEIEFYWNIPEKYLHLPSERYFLAQYFERKNQPYNFTFKNAKTLIDTYIDELENLKVNINRYKWISESPLQEHFANRVIYL